MTTKTIFETCRPRADVLRGTVAEADFAADLAQVVTGVGSPEYVDPVRFFANSYPTRGLKNLLANVCRRLSGVGGEAAAIFRLDTSYGGGKTHGLIALAHAARGVPRVAGMDEFIDLALLPHGAVRLAAFDGENADPANGRTMGEGVRAHTPWGELAYALAGKSGYDRVRNSDAGGVAPGADTLRELFGGQPTLILLDELSVYLRKVQQLGAARDQMTAFLTSLFKAVEGTPRAALVYTLAIGKEGRAMDAYSVENQFIADRMAEAESVSARKATLLNPTEDDETAQVLRRRLFQSIDEGAAQEAVAAYQAVWSAKRDAIAEDATRPETAEGFKASYPLHPEVLQTLTSKTATLETFQRVRGMLRLLARTIAHLWETRPADATAIHLHHVDPGYEPVRQEIVTRLQQSSYVPAIANDVAGTGGAPALAQDLDAKHHGGLPPYATYVARTIFMHTLAFNEPLKGLPPEQLRYSMLGPTSDVSFIEEARKKFLAESAYLDDRPGAPMRFLADANLTQVIRREEKNVDSGEARAELNDRIGQIFRGGAFDAIRFPGGPFDVPDDVGGGRPKLVVLAYDAVTVGATEDVPELVRRIYVRKGSDGSALRLLRNNVVFVVADDGRKAEMRRHASRRLALRELKKPERLAQLAEHQRDKVCELEARSEQELALAIQQCYRHVSGVEQGVAELLRYDDCPVWSAGQYLGVVSRIDALFVVRSWITEHDIARFLANAQYVLSESDPTRELPEPPAPLAGRPLPQHAPGAKFFGQPRRYSDALRTGVCETLTLLSVHGNALFRDRLGIPDVPESVAAIVNRLLTPFTHETLRQHADHLPGFAEATPDAFLALLQEDLTRPKPALLEVLKPARAGMSGDNPVRCGVLWALERLAWNPQNLMPVVNILARLSQTRLDDNLFNKPINSLFAIFCSGVPQTAAPLPERMAALEALCRRFPDIGWRTCIHQFDGFQHNVLSARPRWRNDAAGAGQPVAQNERREFIRKTLDLVVSWPTHDKTMLGDLVELLGSMSEQERSSTWNRIDAWARTGTDEKAKAELRERIRRAVFTPWGRLRNLDADQRDRAHATCESLASRDPVLRHAWIFANSWVGDLTDLADDGEDDPADLSRQTERLRQLRTKAMAEIWSVQGLDGALALLPDSDAWWVGHYAASYAADRRAATNVLRTCLSADPDSDGRLDDFVRGFLGFFGEDSRAALVSTVSAGGSVEHRARLFGCAPFSAPTWRLLDRQDPCVRERYWRTVQPRRVQFSESETTEIIDGLLEAERPKDAFEAVQCDWGKVETGRLRRLLMAIEAEFTVVGIDRYRVSEALESLDGRAGVTVDEMAQLELAFIEALDPLDHAKHGIPNLERRIAESPLFFVQAVVLSGRPWEGEKDRPESRTEGADGRSCLRHSAYRLLDQLTRIPGMDARGGIDSRALMEWVVEARRVCRERGQAEIGDRGIGQLLSRAPAEHGGRRWPCEPVCEVLEAIASEDVARGFRTGVEFGRLRRDGMRLLDEAGAQERERAAKYRAWEDQWRLRYPNVASILRHMAEDHGRAATSWDSRVLEGKRLEH